MTKSKIVEIFKRLDDEKFTLLPRGVAFELIIRDKDNGQYLHTGIGTGEDMSLLLFYSANSLYKTLKEGGGFTRPITIEEFAEDIKEKIIRSYNEDLFNTQLIDGGEE